MDSTTSDAAELVTWLVQSLGLSAGEVSRLTRAWNRSRLPQLGEFLIQSGVMSDKGYKTWKLTQNGYVRGVEPANLVDREVLYQLVEREVVVTREVPVKRAKPKLIRKRTATNLELVDGVDRRAAPDASGRSDLRASASTSLMDAPMPSTNNPAGEQVARYQRLMAKTLASVPVSACVCASCSMRLRLAPSQRGEEIQCPSCSALFRAPQFAFEPGTIVNDFLFEAELGRGANGVVYRCRQLSLDRRVAVKILPGGGEEEVAAFMREARIVARLNHPNIVQAFAVAQVGDCRLLAIECVEGQSLTELLAQRQVLSLEEGLRIGAAVARGLEYAWTECSLVHMDIKPANIMLHRGEQVKLTDFGLAQTILSAAHADEDRIVGTPLFMPPEMIRGDAIDWRADQYSLGAVLYTALCGAPPFMGISLHGIMEAHLERTPEALTALNPELSAGASDLVLRMLEKKPADRFQSYGALVDAIGAVQRQRTGLRAGLTTVMRRISNRLSIL